MGAIPAEDVHLPNVYVQGIIKGDAYEKRIEVSVHRRYVSGMFLPFVVTFKSKERLKTLTAC